MEPTDLTTQIVAVVFAIVAPILSTLIVGLALKALQKLGLTVDAEKRAKLEHLTAQLVAQTEEWASARLKAGVSVAAAEKAQHYLKLAADALPGVSTEEAHALAQQTLGKIRMGTAAVLSDVRVAATTGAR
jgi:outer membrane scaffolding protein for murein synthesis (MipA/OmpV family)